MFLASQFSRFLTSASAVSEFLLTGEAVISHVLRPCTSIKLKEHRGWTTFALTVGLKKFKITLRTSIFEKKPKVEYNHSASDYIIESANYRKRYKILRVC